MTKVGIGIAATHLTELVEAAAGGEEVVITQDGRPVAKLISAGSRRVCRKFGSAQGLVTVAEDFDAPVADLADYS